MQTNQTANRVHFLRLTFQSYVRMRVGMQKRIVFRVAVLLQLIDLIDRLNQFNRIEATLVKIILIYPEHRGRCLF